MIHINIQCWSRFGELSWSWSFNHLLVINLLFRIWFCIINILSTCAYGENEKSTRSLFGRKFKVTSFGVSRNCYRKWSYREISVTIIILVTFLVTKSGRCHSGGVGDNYRVNRIPTVKLKIPGKAFLKSESRISVTFKL